MAFAPGFFAHGDESTAIFAGALLLDSYCARLTFTMHHSRAS